MTWRSDIMQDGIRSLRWHAVHTRDGEIGTVEDVLFDERDWRVRYLVVECGAFLLAGTVLVPTHLASPPDRESSRIQLDLDKEAIRHAAAAGAQRSLRLAGLPEHTWIPQEWGGYLGLPRPDTYADGELRPAPRSASLQAPSARQGALRTAREVRGLPVVGLDGSLGRLAELVLDDATWRVPALLVDTRSWLPGRVRIETELVRGIDRAGVHLALTRREVADGAPLAGPGVRSTVVDRGAEGMRAI